MSKWALATVMGIALAGVANAGDEAPPPGGEAKVECWFTSDSQLKIKNVSPKAALAAGKIVQVTYKYADGSVKPHEVKIDSAVAAKGDISVRVPERAPGATCSAKIK